MINEIKKSIISYQEHYPFYEFETIYSCNRKDNIHSLTMEHYNLVMHAIETNSFSHYDNQWNEIRSNTSNQIQLQHELNIINHNLRYRINNQTAIEHYLFNYENKQIYFHPQSPIIHSSTFIKKNKIHTFHTDIQFILHLKEEKIIALDDIQKQNDFFQQPHEYLFRYKQKRSFVNNSFIQIDISIVKEAVGKNIYDSDLLNKNNHYEIEIEFKQSPPFINGKKLDKLANEYLQLIYTLKAIIDKTPYPLTNTLKKQTYQALVHQFYPHLIHTTTTNDKQITISLPIPNVLPINYKHIDETNSSYLYHSDTIYNYFVTTKTDGYRCLLYCYNNNLYYIFPNGNVLSSGLIIKNSTINCNINNSIIDGELVYSYKNGDDIKQVFHYIAFDIYYYNNNDARMENYLQRIRYLNIVINFIQSNYHNRQDNYLYKNVGDIHIFVKKVWIPQPDGQNLLTCIQLAHNDIISDSNNYLNDGLIIQTIQPLIGNHEHCIQSNVTQFKKAEKWEYCLKWKPTHLLSIDFILLEYNKMTHQIYLGGYHNTNDMFDIWNCTKYCNNCRPILENYQHYFQSNINQNCINGDRITTNCIIECSLLEYNDQNNTCLWKPLKIRYDKKYPNHEKAIHELFILSLYPITIEHLLQNLSLQSFNLSIIHKYQDENYMYKIKQHNKENSKTFTYCHQLAKSNFLKTLYEKSIQTNILPSLSKYYILDLACGRWSDMNIWINTLSELFQHQFLYMGMDLSENEITGSNGACNRLINYKNKCLVDNVNYYQNYIFLQGNCLLDWKNPHHYIHYKYAKIYNTIIHNQDDIKSSNFDLYLPPNDHALCYTINRLNDDDEQSQRKKFHFIGINFALHYLFNPNDNYHDLQEFVNNISMNLENNGYLYGICFNKIKVLQFFQKRNYEDYIYQQNNKIIFSIKYVNDYQIMVFLESIGIDKEEYLVDFNILSQLLLNQNIFQQSLEDFTDYLQFDNTSINIQEYQPYSIFTELNSCFLYQRKTT